ncbi:hypothetical protein [Dietzia psychralcaliphila]|uniref:Type VII secretion protein EccE n=2 Tax=Dietzia psychralcaliphila TaxID=139021 RepID=A0AAD0JUU4_9ACTN|nr:hypothetical protein [Dietzia psychralcaliphila]AWH96141.1 hypothetical protein A6048_12255 [Dietzia psychralcaliphila]PTM90798.1 hypothetical protein C8N39_101556 [Dietzia psychralcaliphila]
MTVPHTLLAYSAVLVSSVVLAVICPQHWQPWVQFTAASLVACAVTVRHRGRPLLSRGPHPRRTEVDVVDLVSPELSLVGCVEGHRVVTTGVELSAGALITTEVGRDDPADFRGVRLPLSAVARQLDQGGVLLEGIDVVVHGRRAAPGPDGEVYGSLVGPLALISHRRVHLLLRFDLADLALTSTDGTGVGGAVEGGATEGGAEAGSLQQVIAVATERLRRSLVHHGVPCRVLDAAELAERYLEAEADPRAGVGLVVRPGSDPRELVDGLTAVRSSDITEVVRLRRVKGRRDVVDAVSTVGLAGVSVESLPSSASSCHPLPSARVLPVPGESLPVAVAGSVVRRRLDQLDALAPPAHGCGQILGATRTGNAAAVQLAGPHLRSVLLAAGPAVCRQVAFRAVAAGYRVAVVTDVPDRWRALRAIADESRYRIVDPDASDAGAPVDAVFWDVDGPLSEGRIDAFAGPGGPDVTPPTVIRVDADWDVPRPGRATAENPHDLVLDGRIAGWISVEPRTGPTRRVTVVTGPGEDAFVGRIPDPADLTPAGVAPSASPDRR